MERVLNYWLINVPENTALFCRLVLVESLISSLERPFGKIIHAMGKVKMPCIISGIVYLCVLPVSYSLLKAGFPAYIPFVILIITKVMGLAYNLLYIHKNIELSIIQFFRQVITPIFLIVICSLPVSLTVNYCLSDTLISLLVVTITTVLSVSVSVYLIGFSKDTRIRIINRVFRKFSVV
jgi:hypothetical protein